MSELEKWVIDNDLGSSRTLSYEHESSHILVLLVDHGSGLVNEDIYVYVRRDSSSEWNLRLLQRTGTTVSVERSKDGNSLVFKGRIHPQEKATKTLLLVPLDAL